MITIWRWPFYLFFVGGWQSKKGWIPFYLWGFKKFKNLTYFSSYVNIFYTHILLALEIWINWSVSQVVAHCSLAQYWVVSFENPSFNILKIESRTLSSPSLRLHFSLICRVNSGKKIEFICISRKSAYFQDSNQLEIWREQDIYVIK